MKLQSQHLYLLSINVSEYLAPAVPNLPGCLKDRERVKQFFIDRLGVPQSHVTTLSDKNATRHNIIDAFRKRFANLPEGSIALFHFSGHGSWEKTSAEFVEAGIEAPGGKNETLVPYDGGNSGNKNITDKELRLLVAELQVDQPTPFVALLDCCHSSSQFRNAVSDTGSSLFRSRLRPGNQKPRALKDYLEGQFVNKDQLVLSDINYVSISACAAHEYALEGNDGGIFTTALIQLLEKYLQAGTWPSYATLFGAINNGPL
jgi:hypothetical protein